MTTSGVTRPVLPLPMWLERIVIRIQPSAREAGYRAVSGVFLLLWAAGVLKQEEAAVWTQLGISIVTMVFAALYATSPWRLALYGLIVPVSVVLTQYGTATGLDWPLIASAVAQVLGITTAAAKTVQAPLT